MLTSISNKDKKLRIPFPPSPPKKKKRNPWNILVTRRINNSSPLPYVSLSNDSPFCLKKKRKNHSRKRLFKRIKTKDWEKNKHNTTNERIKPLFPHYLSSPSFPSFVSSKRKKIKKGRKNFCPNFVRVRHGMSRPREEEDQDPFPYNVSLKNAGTGRTVCPFSRRVPAL